MVLSRMIQPQVGVLVEMPSVCWLAVCPLKVQPSIMMSCTTLPVPPLALTPNTPSSPIESMVSASITT